MSTLLGILQVVGRGGNELFIFDDALVRAATGVGAALMNVLGTDKGSSAEALLTAMSGDLDSYATRTPEQIAAEIPSNLLVWTSNVRSAVLTRGRWPSTAQRRLTLTSPTGATLDFSWPGDGATRPLNHDEYAVAVLSKALPGVLEVRLRT